jgi:WD40 repeat protein
MAPAPCCEQEKKLHLERSGSKNSPHTTMPAKKRALEKALDTALTQKELEHLASAQLTLDKDEAHKDEEHKLVVRPLQSLERGELCTCWKPSQVLPRKASAAIELVHAGTPSCNVAGGARHKAPSLWLPTMSQDPKTTWFSRLPGAGNVACCDIGWGRLVFGTDDGKVYVCMTADLADVHTVPERHGLPAVPASTACVLTGDRVAWSLDGCLLVADRRLTRTTLYVPHRQSDGKLAQILCITGVFSGTGAAWGSSDGTVRVCLVDMDMPSRMCRPTMNAAVVKIAASADDALLVAVSASGQVRIYDTLTGHMVRELGRDQAAHKSDTARACVATFAPDSCLCVVGYTDGLMEIWDTVHAVCVASVQPPLVGTGGSGRITQLCVLGRARTSTPAADDAGWGSLTGHASLPVGSYHEYSGIAAGTASGAVLFWPWCRGRGMVAHGERSIVANQYVRRVPVVGMASSGHTLMCVYADGGAAFVGSSGAVPAGFWPSGEQSEPQPQGEAASVDDTGSADKTVDSAAEASVQGATDTGSVATASKEAANSDSAPTSTAAVFAEGTSTGAPSAEVRTSSTAAASIEGSTGAPRVETSSTAAASIEGTATFKGEVQPQKQEERVRCDADGEQQGRQETSCEDEEQGEVAAPCHVPAPFRTRDDHHLGTCVEVGGQAAHAVEPANAQAVEAADAPVSEPSVAPTADHTTPPALAPGFDRAAAAPLGPALASVPARGPTIAPTNAYGLHGEAAVILWSLSGELRVVVAHGGKTVVQYGENMQPTGVLVGPGSGNGVRLAGAGLASLHGSPCGKYVVVFDCGGRMFLFDGREYVGTVTMHAAHLQDMTCVIVGEDAGGMSVVIGTCTRMVIARLHGGAPKVSEFSLEVAVTCIGFSPAGGTVYGCIDGTVCVSDFRTVALSAADRTPGQAQGQAQGQGHKRLDASCGIVCQLESSVTSLAPFTTTEGHECILAGCADGCVAVWDCQDQTRGWITPTGSMTAITAFSTCTVAGIYAAATGNHVFVGSLRREGVFFQRLDSMGGTVCDVALYSTCDNKLRLAFVTQSGRVQTWDLQNLAISQVADE